MTPQAVGLSSKGADFNDSMYATPLNSAHAVGKFCVYEKDGHPRRSLSVSLSDRWITDHKCFHPKREVRGREKNTDVRKSCSTIAVLSLPPSLFTV